MDKAQRDLDYERLKVDFIYFVETYCKGHIKITDSKKMENLSLTEKGKEHFSIRLLP